MNNTVPIAQGLTLAQLAESETTTHVGDDVKLRVYTGVDQHVLNDLDAMLDARMVALLQPTIEDNGIVSIVFRKTGDHDIDIVGTCAYSVLEQIEGWQLFNNRARVPLWAVVTGIVAAVWLLFSRESRLIYGH